MGAILSGAAQGYVQQKQAGFERDLQGQQIDLAKKRFDLESKSADLQNQMTQLNIGKAAMMIKGYQDYLDRRAREDGYADYADQQTKAGRQGQNSMYPAPVNPQVTNPSSSTGNAPIAPMYPVVGANGLVSVQQAGQGQSQPTTQVPSSSPVGQPQGQPQTQVNPAMRNRQDIENLSMLSDPNEFFRSQLATQNINGRLVESNTGNVIAQFPEKITDPDAMLLSKGLYGKSPDDLSPRETRVIDALREARKTKHMEEQSFWNQAKMQSPPDAIETMAAKIASGQMVPSMLKNRFDYGPVMNSVFSKDPNFNEQVAEQNYALYKNPAHQAKIRSMETILDPAGTVNQVKKYAALVNNQDSTPINSLTLKAKQMFSNQAATIYSTLNGLSQDELQRTFGSTQSGEAFLKLAQGMTNQNTSVGTYLANLNEIQKAVAIRYSNLTQGTPDYKKAQKYKDIYYPEAQQMENNFGQQAPEQFQSGTQLNVGGQYQAPGGITIRRNK